MLAGDALRVELDSVGGALVMGDRHDEAVVGFGADFECGRGGSALDDERVIAGGLKGFVQAVKKPACIVRDARNLAVHRQRRSHHVAAKSLTDGLVAEADAEDRGRLAGGANKIETDTRLVRRAWPRREDDRVGRVREGFLHADFIVSPHCNVRAKLAEIVDEVEREAVIVVDQRDALHSSSRSGGAVFSDAAPRPSSRARQQHFKPESSMTYRASPADGAAWVTGASR